MMENILFKISFPAEFHAQTACEAAVTLHPEVKDRLDEIERIVLTTHDSAIRIISKEGELANPADRDHCLQYMTAVPLIFGGLTAEHYEDAFHEAHPRIDELRRKMEVVEDERYSRDYYDPQKRAIANAVQVFFSDAVPLVSKSCESTYWILIVKRFFSPACFNASFTDLYASGNSMYLPNLWREQLD